MSENGPGFQPPFPDSAEPAPADSSRASAKEELSADKPAPPVPPPSPPVVPAAAAPAAPPVLFAGFWRRVSAILIDALLLFVVGIAANALTRAIAGVPLTPIWRESSGGNPMYNCLESLIGIVIGWLYFASLESSEKQATLGKMAIGLRVTDLSGRRISFARATGRHFAQIFDVLTLFVGYAMAGFTAKKQALHDMIAGTLVVRS